MDIREYPCCMCPALEHDFQKEICDGQSIFLRKIVGPCNFVNRFKDDRGRLFFVRKGLGDNNYKTFFMKPGQKYSEGRWYRNLPWCKSFRIAQEDLNKLALKKGWIIA